MESKAKDYCIRAAIALLLMMFTGISAWAQDPASIGSIQYNSTLGAYEINSVQNLNDLAVYVNGTGTYSDNTTTETTAHSCEGLTFKQTANITYTGTNNYTPIGLYVNDDGFQGTFDGQGNTISGIYCTGDGLTGEGERLGLFGWNQGTVRNVTLSGCRFTSANNESFDNDAIYVRIGSIAGENDDTGTITGCTVTGGTVSRTRTADAESFETLIGGIAGENYGNITGCTYSCSVSGTYSGSNINRRCVINIGGIAGISKNGGSITGCGSDAAVSCSAPNVSAPSLFVGGIAGLNNGSNRDVTVSDCFFSGTLSGTGKTGGNTSYIYIGAFVGRSINSSIVTNNYYYGDYASPIGYEDSKVTLANLVRVYQLTGNGITATAPQGSGTTFKGVSYFKADATVTLAPQAGYVLTAANYNDSSEDHVITPDNGVWSFQMPSSDVTVSATWEPAKNITVTANKVGSNYWTTFYCGEAGYRIDEDEKTTAYTATVNNSTVTLHLLGKVIPMGTAAIIIGEDNSISMNRDDFSIAEYSADNDLHGVDVRTLKSTLDNTDTGTFYVMGKKGDDFGFFEYTADYMPARKAYLLINDGKALAKELRMVIEEDADGIDSLTPTLSKGEGAIYNLAGQRVSQKALTQRGSGEGARIYIINGKKVLK